MANEKRLIDAWRLVIDLAKLQKYGEYDHENVLAVIASQKTGDAVEVVHGKWLHQPDKRICPFCNYRYSYFGGKDYNYCPNCGADMRGMEE